MTTVEVRGELQACASGSCEFKGGLRWVRGGEAV